MQAASDIFLGWTEDNKAGRFFYVRHLKNRRLGSIGEVIEGNALAGLRDTLRPYAIARACALGRCCDPRRLYGQIRRPRRCIGEFRDDLRGADQA